MKNRMAVIAANRKIAAVTYEMRLRISEQPADDAGAISAGQFINIRINGFYLRRPISICSIDCRKDELLITIVYKTAGAGTETMARMREGESLDILIPLGKGFNPEGAGTEPLLVGGGAGVAPIFELCRRLVAEGAEPVAVLGFNTAEEVFYQKEFEALGVRTIITTADGSRGVKGFVTDALQNLTYTSFFACGPEPMLKALDESIPGHIPGQLSFEERMGCGFGACMGCSCRTKYGSKRICKDGPVLERREIIW